MGIETHIHHTEFIMGSNLNETCVLVGDSGGLCAVYQASRSSAMPGLMAVETEHGILYLDPDHEYEILKRI